MADKMGKGNYPDMLTPLDEEGNRTSNDPPTMNPSMGTDAPDPLGITHGIFKGGKAAKGGKTNKG